MRKSVLLDTSFFLRFLNESDALFKNADEYFRYFLKEEITMMISTISIAEYCVGGEIQELPLRNLQILPFNIDHSIRAGEFARVAFQEKRNGKLELTNRIIIPNDAKLFCTGRRRILNWFLFVIGQREPKGLRHSQNEDFSKFPIHRPEHKL